MDEPPPPRSVLIANDHEWTARSLETILAANGFAVIRAFTARQAIEKAADMRPDAFVLDVQLPDLDGMTLCRMLREDPSLGPTTPIIVTTAGPSGRRERLAAHRAGAWDFLGQPLDGEVLLAKLAVFLEGKTVVDRLRQDSLVDPETGLYSRAGLLRRSREMAAEGARRNQVLGCVVLHANAPRLDSAIAVTEEVGRRVGEFLRRSGRSADAIGRLGMVEFGVVTLGANVEELRQFVNRLNGALTGTQAGEGVTLRAAVWSASNGDPADPEARLAEAALAVRHGEEALAVVPGH